MVMKTFNYLKRRIGTNWCGEVGKSIWPLQSLPNRSISATTPRSDLWSFTTSSIYALFTFLCEKLSRRAFKSDFCLFIANEKFRLSSQRFFSSLLLTQRKCDYRLQTTPFRYFFPLLRQTADFFYSSLAHSPHITNEIWFFVSIISINRLNQFTLHMKWFISVPDRYAIRLLSFNTLSALASWIKDQVHLFHLFVRQRKNN